MAACLASVIQAQTPKVEHFSTSDLLVKAQELEATAKNGAASVKLSEYPNHFTMVSLRHQTGNAEVHENFADFFLVVEGTATLLTGGTVQDPKTDLPGEIRGAAILNGTSTTLHPGDVVHIPATIPHQLLVTKDSTFVYYVIKVKEK